MYIAQAPITAGTPDNSEPILCKIVFNAEGTDASEPPNTNKIPFAIPTTTAVPAKSAAPDWNEEAISLTFISSSLKITAMIQLPIPSQRTEMQFLEYNSLSG